MEQVEITYFRYPEEFKRQVIREYQIGYSMEHLRRKYNIKGKVTISRWLIQMGLRPVSRNSYLAATKQKTLQDSKSKQKTLPPTLEELQQQLVTQQEKLLNAELRAEMLDRMISVAEKDHHISIRKKANTK